MKNVADVYHLTPVQREVLRDSSSARVVQVRWQLSGELNSEAFERAWQQLLARHAMLRTCFLMAELKEPVQVVRQQVKLQYERYDLGRIDAEHQRSELQDLLRMDRRREFDPARAPLFRVMEVRLNGASFEIVLSHHPVLVDERSVGVMLEEVLAVYRAASSKVECVFEEAAPAFRDYVGWVERQDLSGAELFFRDVKGAPVVQRANQNPDAGAVISRALRFDDGQIEGLRRFARSAGVSIETLITGAWALVLMRERDGGEVTVGVQAAERPRALLASLAESQQMIGLLSNVMPLSIISPVEEPLSTWLQELERKRTKLQRYAHVSHAQIRDWLGLTADEPLFDNAVVFHDPSSEEILASNSKVDSPVCLEVTLGDELALQLHTRVSDQLHASDSDAERTSIRLIDDLANALRSFIFPPLALATKPLTTYDKQPLEFSLFYFADDNAVYGEDKYRLYREGAIFADRHGLTAVWTPERHFHEKAGLYPNPSVLSAALATITEHVSLRAGSVVLPLHNSLRVAEEWSVVDNLSSGRVGVSFTSGWMPNDFAFFPERYPTKRDEMFRGIQEVQELWRGNAIPGRDGVGKEIELRIFPKPIQSELPMWLTCSGGPEMFEKAGELGCYVLTALLTQSLEEVAPKIKLYRDSLIRHGHDPSKGKVTMMMHTFIGEDAEAVLQKVRAPLTNYLKSHLNLIETGAQSLNLAVEIREDDDPEKYRDQMAAFAFQRYYRTSSLIGTPSSCMKMVERLKAIGVDEVACLIDFGIDVDSVLESLEHLVVLKDLSNSSQPEEALLASTAAHV